ncbi:hypothetical protein BSL78_09625 [Apostichopus japonicus]|uniref:Uncharacterized protein n=1 Tax=Stichopus japonicus TaxID=307972 RepID=A0A2G8KZU7_STIJA|nr:hypothetical protein BSL78_09625 [Apostichopus japonicus]
MLEEMKQEYPELESLSDFVISDITKVIYDKVVITESAESVVDIAGIKAKDYRINGMTISSGGNIVMTVCRPDEIGIYNISNSSYQKKNISDMVKTWPEDRTCFCYHEFAKNEIIVGTHSREVYVFDYQLNYSHTIVLPDEIKASYDITVHDGYLLICDNWGRTSYAVTMVTSGSKVLYKFTKPNISGADLRPVSVCIGMGGFIYILWHGNSRQNPMLTQYSRDGRQLLTTMPVDDGARCITTSVVDGEEKLVIATSTTGKMHIHGLVPA